MQNKVVYFLRLILNKACNMQKARLIGILVLG